MLRRLARGALDLRNTFRSTFPSTPTATNAESAKSAAGVRTGALILLAGFAFTGIFTVSPALARASREPAPAATSVTVIGVAELPPEGRKTYGLIRSGGPFPFEKDGVVFGNREKLLPPFKRGYYREYTVVTPSARNRGAQRIVCGGAPRTPDRCYYTADHYSSFREIVE
jgi:ribonuclease T1